MNLKPIGDIIAFLELGLEIQRGKNLLTLAELKQTYDFFDKQKLIFVVDVRNIEIENCKQSISHLRALEEKGLKEFPCSTELDLEALKEETSATIIDIGLSVRNFFIYRNRGFWLIAKEINPLELETK